MLRFDIEQKWNGRPSTRRERVIVVVEDDGDCLKVVVDAPFHGDPAPEGPPGSTPGLWDHEVVELFIAGAGTEYLELEFGPFGHYLALSFSDVREQSGGPHALEYRTAVLKHAWTGTARVPRALLPAGPYRMNATAIHGHPVRHRRFLSAQVLPGAKPDFHQPEHFRPVEQP
ncbi:MAG: hypothetical protein CL927_03120 [Deltaproteobacteria bacterium]|nr:hypothetical protein [Deltaproteobacteria bacterium]